MRNPLCTWLLVFTCLLGLWPSVSYSASLSDNKYDQYFREAQETYLPFHDWRLLKAQCYQESRLNPDAQSPVGAKGVCQFMDGTWGDMGIDESVWDAKWNILMAGKYMGRLHKGWSSPRPEADRYSLALASYNAGFGNILKAQKKCGGSALYSEIMKCLPDVTGKNSVETTDYVKYIWNYYVKLVIGI